MRAACGAARVAGLLPLPGPVPASIPENGKILLIGPNHLGDLLQARPLLCKMRSQYPSAERCFAGDRFPGQFVLDGIGIQRTVLWPGKGVALGRPVGAWRELFAAERPDAVVLTRGRGELVTAAWAALRAGIPVRVGSAEKGFGGLFTHTYGPVAWETTVAHQEGLARAMMGSGFGTGESVRWPTEIPPAAAHLPQPDVLLVPFAQHRHWWLPERWRDLARRILAEGRTVGLLGSPDFQDDANTYAIDEPGFHNLVGQTGLDDVFALTSRAKVMVTLCTGTRHIAAATGTPAVVIGHGTEPVGVIGKYVPTETYLRADVPCAPCGATFCPLEHINCVRHVGVDEVFAAYEAVVAN